MAKVLVCLGIISVLAPSILKTFGIVFTVIPGVAVIDTEVFLNLVLTAVTVDVIGTLISACSSSSSADAVTVAVLGIEAEEYLILSPDTVSVLAASMGMFCITTVNPTVPVTVSDEVMVKGASPSPTNPAFMLRFESMVNVVEVCSGISTAVTETVLVVGIETESNLCLTD
jgi:uncharacterized membrane protein